MRSVPVEEALPARYVPVPSPFRIRNAGRLFRCRHSKGWGSIALAITLGFLSHFVLREWTKTDDSTQSRGKEDATGNAIRFYAARVASDPEDTRSQNALAQLYLQRIHESGNEDYLPLALQAATASLKAVPPERNFGGLLGLAQVEFANHAFLAARDHAERLRELDPNKAETYGALGDAYLELGEYERANEAFQKMRALDDKNAGAETRLGRLAFLHGSSKKGQEHFNAALVLVRAQRNPPNESIAWCQWQLGEIAFAAGDYRAAEKYYRDALQTAPNNFRTLAGMGRICDARGDSAGAINYYEQAARIAPTLDFMATLGDLYQRAGRSKEAAAHYELVEQLSEHSRKVHGTTFDRRLALFYADHDLKIEEAYALARAEYASGRHDIYGADALAWTAFKSGRIEEAKTVMKEALRLGTIDPRLSDHAGMIERKANGISK
jgi:tetratricopeptide (TPR) repeat protein